MQRRRGRLCHLGDPLRTSRERLSRRAVRRPPCMCSHGDSCFPNSNNSIRLHFSRPRGLFVPNAERFDAGSRSRSHACLGHLQNTERTSHAASRGAGAVSKITPSVTRPTSPVWVGPCPISHIPCHSYSAHILTHTLGHSHRGLMLAQKIPGFLYSRSLACAQSHHIPALPCTALLDFPRHGLLRGSIPSPLTPVGG